MNNFKKNRSFSLITARIAICFLVIISANFATADDRDAVDKYFAANALYNKKLFKLAAEEYKSFAAKYPDHEKTDRGLTF